MKLKQRIFIFPSKTLDNTYSIMYNENKSVIFTIHVIIDIEDDDEDDDD